MYTNQIVMRLSETVRQQVERLESMRQQLETLSQHVNGIGVANVLVFELLLSQLPAQRAAISEALSQILARAELESAESNEFCLGLLRSFEKVARNPLQPSA